MDPQLLTNLDNAVTQFRTDADQQLLNLAAVAKAQTNVNAAQAALTAASQVASGNAAALQTDLDAINVAAAALGLVVNVPVSVTTTTLDPTTPTTAPPA